MKEDLKFILVDDDPFNNILSDMMVKDVLGEVDVKAFTKPEEGLVFIENEYAKSSERTILFLDINMPRINGWEFLERYDHFDKHVKEQINIYILSSSLDQRDKNKADANQNVKGFISKPLDFEKIYCITEKVF